MSKLLLALGLVVGLGTTAGPARAQAAAFSIPPYTISPDGRYGALVPDAALIPSDAPTVNGEDFPQDKLVEVKTGRVLAVIPSRPRALNDASDQNSPHPYWSPDSSLLVWLVEGKWSSAALSIFKLEDGKVKWESNVLKAARLAMLNRTMKTGQSDFTPIAGLDHVDDQAYPNGFSIDVYLKGNAGLAEPFGPAPLQFPLSIHADLTSDAKGINATPPVQADLDGVVDATGKFTVTRYHLGAPTVPPRNW
jgi:hypothetical protein